MTELVQRYTWEDALIEAERVGKLSSGPVNTALRLARVINWAPKDGRPSGLYWKNELAAEVVSVSRATLFRNIKELKSVGFLLERGGNLLPSVPESHNETVMTFLEMQQQSVKSHTDTESLKVRLVKSQDETTESQSDNPYSEDIYTEDNTVMMNTKAAVVVDTPTLPTSSNVEQIKTHSPNKELVSTSNDSEERFRQSHNETGHQEYRPLKKPTEEVLNHVAELVAAQRAAEKADEEYWGDW